MTCNHCKKNRHTELRWWIRFSHLHPQNKSDRKSAFLASEEGGGELVICPFNKHPKSNALIRSRNWFNDSRCSHHITFDKSISTGYVLCPGSKSREFVNEIMLQILGHSIIEAEEEVKGKNENNKTSN